MNYFSRVELARQGFLVESQRAAQGNQPSVIAMKGGNCSSSNANLTNCARQSKLIRNSLHWEEFFGNLDFFFLLAI
jgi:hypothetical protein